MAEMHMIQQFSPVPPGIFEAICAEVLQKTGVKIESDEGQGEGKGITIRWKYDRVKNSLETQLLKRSWFDPSEVDIDQQIHNIVERHMQSSQ